MISLLRIVSNTSDGHLQPIYSPQTIYELLEDVQKERLESEDFDHGIGSEKVSFGEFVTVMWEIESMKASQMGSMDIEQEPEGRKVDTLM